MARSMPPARPHGDLEEVLPGVFFVSGTMKMSVTKFSRNMVVLRDGDRLVLVNSLRLGEEGLAALDALGRVTDVVRLAGFHGSDDPFYKERYGAKVWAVKGQTYFTGLNPAKGEIYFEPDALMEPGGELPLAGASLHRFDTEPAEGILRIAAGGGTIITGDSLQNWATADRWFNWLARFVMGRMGFLEPHQLGPGWVKSLKPNPAQVAAVLELNFENVLPGHGAAVLGDGPAKYRPVIEAYVASTG